jgi:hypothetical protein
MTSTPDTTDKPTTAATKPPNFVVWIIKATGGWASGTAVWIGLAGLALRAPIHRLLVPWAALAGSGLVLSPLLYWARLAPDGPKGRVRRVVIGQLIFLPVLGVAVLFDGVWLGVVSRRVAWSLAPATVLLTIFFTVIAYAVARAILISGSSASDGGATGGPS